MNVEEKLEYLKERIEAMEAVNAPIAGD